MMRFALALFVASAIGILSACKSERSGTEGHHAEGHPPPHTVDTDGDGVPDAPHPDSLARPQGPLPDSLVTHPDSTPKFDGFIWFFPHVTPSALHLRQGGIAVDGAAPRPATAGGRIPNKLARLFLNRDTTRSYYYVLRLMPDPAQAQTDTVVRVIFADSLDFHLATFRTTGQLVDTHPLTRRGVDASGRSVEEQTYFYPRSRTFETFRNTAGQRTVLMGRFGQDGQITADAPANNSFFAVQDVFPLKPLPFRISPDMDGCLSALEAMPRRLHPAYVVANWDTGYKPILIGQEFIYGTVYLPYARLYLSGGRVGLVVQTAEYRANSALNQYILFIYESNGSLTDRAPIASVMIENTATMDKAVVESCELAPDYTLTLNKLLVRENVTSGQHQERQSSRTFRITEQGRIVAQQ